MVLYTAVNRSAGNGHSARGNASVCALGRSSGHGSTTVTTFIYGFGFGLLSAVIWAGTSSNRAAFRNFRPSIPAHIAQQYLPKSGHCTSLSSRSSILRHQSGSTVAALCRSASSWQASFILSGVLPESVSLGLDHVDRPLTEPISARRASRLSRRSKQRSTSFSAVRHSLPSVCSKCQWSQWWGLESSLCHRSSHPNKAKKTIRMAKPRHVPRVLRVFI